MSSERERLIFQSTPSAWRETWKNSDNRSGVSVFQSTPSAWRETQANGTGTYDLEISIHSLRMEGDRDPRCQESGSTHFNPLPPHGGRPGSGVRQADPKAISIHSLRMEGDFLIQFWCISMQQFQSTPSAWRETVNHSAVFLRYCISIHSLRMEGDVFETTSSYYDEVFQSTPSAWRETRKH